MTRRSIVEDNVLGQLARRQHDLFRRVAEGTLDPKTVLDALQLVIENKSRVFPIESIPITLGQQTYTVEFSPAPFLQLLNEWPHKWGYKERDRMEKFRPDRSPPTRKTQSSLRLAKIEKNLAVSAVLHYLCELKVESANVWEAFAFARVASFMRLVRTGNYGIHFFGTTGIVDYAGSESNSLNRYVYFRNSTDVTGCSPDHDGWHLDIGYLKGSSFAQLSEGDYLLVRA
jgi:hypothetical protein